MLDTEIDVLVRIARVLTEGKGLTPAELSEVMRIAQGFACKDSAAAANVSPETIRARRKRIYRKLGLAGAGETLSALLALSLHQVTVETGERAQAREAAASTT